MLPRKTERLIYYPVGFIIVGIILSKKYPEMIYYVPPFADISIYIVLVFMLYFTGYVYGNISLLIRVRDFKSLLLNVTIFIGKLYLSIYLIPYAMIFIVIELISIPIIAKFKNRKWKDEIKKLSANEFETNIPSTTKKHYQEINIK